MTTGSPSSSLTCRRPMYQRSWPCSSWVRSRRPKNSAVVGSSTSWAARRCSVIARNSSETRSPPDARADRVFSRIRASSRRAFSRYACSRARSSVTTVSSGMRKGPSTGGAPSGEASIYLWKAPVGQPVPRTRERRNRSPNPQPGRAARVTLMSCFCEPRMTVMVTVSPTLCSWMLATSASEESIGLPSIAMTRRPSPAARPGRPGCPARRTGPARPGACCCRR